jgi:hypothetical protein
MDKLNKDDIEVVDKIIKYLYGLNFPECLSEYNTQNSSNPLKKEVYDVNQKHKRSETIKEVKTHEMIDSANHVSTHKQIPNKHK